MDRYLRTSSDLRKARDLVASAEKMARNPDLIKVIGNPDKNCKRCYGVGHTGRDTQTRLYILCSCIWSDTPHWVDKRKLQGRPNEGGSRRQ